MELLNPNTPKTPVRAVLFDFDGTVSTLRHGWEAVMKPLMLEMISGGKPYSAELTKEVDDYINESTGIQTIHQMKWLAERVASEGKNQDAPTDPWWYKGEYNRRLMENVQKRLDALKSGEVPNTAFLMEGSEAFLAALCDRRVKLYVASGTDHPDVINEAECLGVAKYFYEIAGAPVAAESCSKEKVIERLIAEEKLSGDDFAVIGDGKVEIRLGKEAGARCIGLASNEADRRGVDPIKRDRLIPAGADIIAGDFSEKDALLAFLGF